MEVHLESVSAPVLVMVPIERLRELLDERGAVLVSNAAVTLRLPTVGGMMDIVARRRGGFAFFDTSHVEVRSYADGRQLPPGGPRTLSDLRLAQLIVDDLRQNAA